MDSPKTPDDDSEASNRLKQLTLRRAVYSTEQLDKHLMLLFIQFILLSNTFTHSTVLTLYPCVYTLYLMKDMILPKIKYLALLMMYYPKGGLPPHPSSSQ